MLRERVNVHLMQHESAYVFIISQSSRSVYSKFLKGEQKKRNVCWMHALNIKFY